MNGFEQGANHHFELDLWNIQDYKIHVPVFLF